MKALNGFLFIQRQMTLKVHRPNVRKLHRPRTYRYVGRFLTWSCRYDFSCTIN